MIDLAMAQTASGAAPAGGSFLMSFLPPAIFIVVFFYLLVIMPQNKERKKQEEMLGAIQRGDRVLTRGGVYGTVADIKEKILVLKIAENTKIEVERSFIETVEKPS